MATWFARQSSVDINASNVWNAAADGSGAWLTWASLGASDVLVANGYTDIAINVDFTCGTITNASTYGGTAGGQFTVSTVAADRTITADIVGQNTGTATSGGCVKATLSSTYTLTIDGDVTGGGIASGRGMSIAGAGGGGKLTVTGTVTGGTHSSDHGIYVLGGQTNITLNNVTGGTSGTGPAANGMWDGDETAGIINLTGIASSPDKCALAINTRGCVVMKPGASLVSNSGTWMFPISGRIKWETTDSGVPITLYDAAGDPHVLKVPDYPAEADVESGVDYDYENYTGTLSASCDYPAEADVQSGVSFGSGVYTGTFTAPAVGDVQSGVTYGGGGTEYEGTFAVPSVGDVADGVTYGAGGTEFTGTLAMLSESQMEAILDARGLTEPASDTADSVARRGASAVTLSDVGTGGGAMHSTTIATLASQTSFTLTAGSADDDAYNYCVAVVTDESTATQKCVGVISDYTGSSKTVTLGADPAIFTMAAGDTVEIYPPAGLRWINGAVASGAATVDANMVSVSDDEKAADTLELFAEALDQATGQIDDGSLAAGTITAATFAADVDDEVRAWIVDNSTGDGVRINSAALNTCTSVTIPAIKNKTDNLPSDPADQSAVEAAITAAVSPLATSVELAAVQTHGDTTWATATGFLDAADVRDAIGMSAANLDTQLSAISGYVDCLPATWVVPPAGSDWTATRAGYIDKLNVTGALAHSDAAATYKADVSALATSAELTALASYGDSHWATATGFSTLDAADVRTALGMATADLDDQLTAIGGTVNSLSSGVTVSDKTGFKLASDGLDAIATTAPSGPATTFREMVVQTWRWFFKRATKTSGSLVTYADDGTTPITTQAITASGTDEERGAAI